MTNRWFWISTLAGAAAWTAAAWLSSWLPNAAAYGTTIVVIAWGLVVVSGAMLGALAYLVGSDAAGAIRKRRSKPAPTKNSPGK
jgi:hypothetical protein